MSHYSETYRCVSIKGKNKFEIQGFPKICINSFNLIKKINEIIIHILTHSFELSKKAYSNYIIQHLLESGHPDHKDKLLNQYVKPNFIPLSCDQFARFLFILLIINLIDLLKKK